MLADYLPTGEPFRLTQRRTGSTDVVRWMRYDSLGRRVLNVEPNTSVSFTTDVNADPGSFKAWRYAYNDAGDLVGTSDARGCGANYFYDTAGRILATDLSPCRTYQPTYTAPNLSTGNGTEAFYRYDTEDPETGSVVDAGGHTFPVTTSLLWGRLASVSDRGMKGIVRYDALGAITGSAARVVKPGTPSSTLSSRYTPRWYIKTTTYDGAGRPVESSTGATTSALLGTGGESVTENHYTHRGILDQVTGSYGTLLAGNVLDANGLPQTITYGDLAGTQRSYSYDTLLRAQSVQTYRSTPSLWASPPPGYGTPAPDEPTQQLLLEDSDFAYDLVNNITGITDWRTASEWPASAKPVTRTFSYDDDYRLLGTSYEYPGGNSWVSPFAAENSGLSSPLPVPHVSFSTRVTQQNQSYDHLGNTTQTTDNSSAFYDRSLGNITQGTATAGPHRMVSASNRTLAPGSTRKGDLSVAYDGSGNVSDLIVRRDGSCLPTGASCWQRFHYEWDELNQLTRARRWDLKASYPNERATYGTIGSPLPTRTPNAELRATYDSSGHRVLKTSIDASGNQLHTAYIFGELEIRRAAYSTDYALSATTETVYLRAGGIRARILYASAPSPSGTSNQHVILEMGDHLGSTTILLDKATSELIESTSYQSYGQTNADYRPARWSRVRDAYKFTDKEEDVEVGLAYFGARYLSLGLGRWMSADPATIHGVRGDANPYAYVAGRVTVATDPNGEFAFLIALGIAVLVGAAISGGVYAATTNESFGSNAWWSGFGRSAVTGAAAGGAGFLLGAAGVGAVGAMAGAGAAGGATGAGLNGGSVGEVAVAALWGAAGGVLGGLASSYAQDGLLYMLEGSGIDLASALHVAAAIGMSSSGAATGFAIEGVHDLFDVNYQANYARAAAIGAVGGLGSYLGAEATGSIRSPGTAYDTSEEAMRAGQAGTRAAARDFELRTTLCREAGTFVYEWGDDYYYTSAVISESYGQINSEWVLQESWIPPGATLEGFGHAHPPPVPGFKPGPTFNHPLGMHPGDISAFESAYWDYKQETGAWLESTVTPDGFLEFWRPGMTRPVVQPRLK